MLVDTEICACALDNVPIRRIGKKVGPKIHSVFRHNSCILGHNYVGNQMSGKLGAFCYSLEMNYLRK